MNDPWFVAAAYAIVLGGLSLYVISIARRVREARRTAQAYDRELQTDSSIPPATQLPEPTGPPSEAPR